MNKKRILITGGSGLLGQYLNLTLSKNFEIFSLYNKNSGNCIEYNSHRIDLKNSTELKKVFETFRPDYLIHSAAITSTLINNNYTLNDYYQNNVVVTKNISQLCATYNVRMIYISTDLVYDGNRGSFLDENSKLNPASPYAESKLLAEEYVKNFVDDFVILRLSLLIGVGLNHSICHFQILYQNLVEQKHTKLFIDQFRTPISLIEASNVINNIIEMNIPKGVYNLGGEERVSRFELGEILVKKFNFDKNLLIPIKLKDVQNVPFVQDVSLNVNKLKNLGIKFSSLEEMIESSLFFKKERT
jgi:dTDP-4-dehydrorhamnose reductase